MELTNVRTLDFFGCVNDVNSIISPCGTKMTLSATNNVTNTGYFISIVKLVHDEMFYHYASTENGDRAAQLDEILSKELLLYPGILTLSKIRISDISMRIMAKYADLMYKFKAVIEDLISKEMTKKRIKNIVSFRNNKYSTDFTFGGGSKPIRWRLYATGTLECERDKLFPESGQVSFRVTLLG
jgi:hypothetical protein